MRPRGRPRRGTGSSRSARGDSRGRFPVKFDGPVRTRTSHYRAAGCGGACAVRDPCLRATRDLRHWRPTRHCGRRAPRVVPDSSHFGEGRSCRHGCYDPVNHHFTGSEKCMRGPFFYDGRRGKTWRPTFERGSVSWQEEIAPRVEHDLPGRRTGARQSSLLAAPSRLLRLRRPRAEGVDHAPLR